MSKPAWLLLLCVAVGLQQNWRKIDHWLYPPTPRPPGTEKVELYATSWCGYCAKTREFFAKNHIRYQEWNVEDGAEGQRGYEKLGGGGVPIIVVNDDTVIRGYDPDGINEALGRTP
jgi:glutaredoxin